MHRYVSMGQLVALHELSHACTDIGEAYLVPSEHRLEYRVTFDEARYLAGVQAILHLTAEEIASLVSRGAPIALIVVEPPCGETLIRGPIPVDDCLACALNQLDALEALEAQLSAGPWFSAKPPEG